MYYVMVYGSLKKGFGNHHLLSRSEFVGNAVTKDSHFSMISLGSFPGVFDEGSNKIKGEVYFVDEMTLRSLDRLESEGSFYSRREYPMVLSDGTELDCFIYILLDKPYWKSYGEEIPEEISGKALVWSWNRQVDW